MIQPFKFKEIAKGISITIGDKSMFFEGVSQEQMDQGLDKYVGGMYVQNAFNFLTPDQREFLISGLLPEEFDSICEEIDDDFEYTYFS